MQCELCGRELSTETAHEVRIEGVLLRVCASCAKHGELIRSPQPRVREQQPKKRVIQKPVREVIEEVVPDAAERLRRAFQRAGRSFQDLARMVQMKESALRAFEQGRRKPSLDEARRLEKAFGVRLVERITLEETPSPGEAKHETGGITLGDIVRIRRRKT